MIRTRCVHDKNTMCRHDCLAYFLVLVLFTHVDRLCCVYIHTHTCIYICMYIYIDIYIYIYIYTYIYIYIHAYIHTCMHTYDAGTSCDQQGRYQGAVMWPRVPASGQQVPQQKRNGNFSHNVCLYVVHVRIYMHTYIVVSYVC